MAHGNAPSLGRQLRQLARRQLVSWAPSPRAATPAGSCAAGGRRGGLRAAAASRRVGPRLVMQPFLQTRSLPWQPFR